MKLLSADVKLLTMNFSLQLIGIQDGYLSLLTESGEVREDLKLPEGDLGKEIEGKFNANEDVQVSSEGRQEHLWLIPLDNTMKKSFLLWTTCLSL